MKSEERREKVKEKKKKLVVVIVRWVKRKRGSSESMMRIVYCWLRSLERRGQGVRTLEQK